MSLRIASRRRSVYEAGHVGRGDRDLAALVAPVDHAQDVTGVAVERTDLMTSPGGFTEAPLSTERLMTWLSRSREASRSSVAAAGTEMSKLRYTAALPTRGQSP